MQNKAGSSVPNQGIRYAIILAVLITASTVVRAADFKGATEVLRQAAQASPKPAQEKTKDPYEPFREKLKAFQAQITNLAPSQAATQWLALVDDFQKASGEDRDSMRRGLGTLRPLQFEEVMKVLPPPAAWVELEKAVEARSPTQADRFAHQGLHGSGGWHQHETPDFLCANRKL